MPSSAYTKFNDRILEVKRLLSLCAPIDADYRIQKENTARDGALLRGAHVLLCSHLEGYFEDLVTDLIDAYDKLSNQVLLIPNELRAFQVMGASSKWDVKDPSRRWQLVQACAKHPLIDVSGSKPLGSLDAALHTDGFSNPGTSEIEELFKSVGICDVWIAFQTIESDPVFKSTIDAIVNRRNQIAHGKADATLTLTDANSYVARAERVAQVFEQIATDEVNRRLSIADCWTALDDFISRAALSSVLEDQKTSDHL